MAEILASVRTSWKVKIYYINRALLELNFFALFFLPVSGIFHGFFVGDDFPNFAHIIVKEVATITNDIEMASNIIVILPLLSCSETNSSVSVNFPTSPAIHVWSFDFWTLIWIALPASYLAPLTKIYYKNANIN